MDTRGTHEGETLEESWERALDVKRIMNGTRALFMELEGCTDEEQVRVDAYRAAMSESPGESYKHFSLLMEGPPDYPLLDDPYNVFEDANRIPKYVGDDVMYESITQWVRRTLIAHSDAHDRILSAISPFPVGRAVFERDMRRYYSKEINTRALLRYQRMLPFEGDEYANLVLTFERHGARVDIFGMVTPIPDKKDHLFFWCAPAQVVWRGASPYTVPGNRLEPFVKKAIGWWETVGKIAFPRTGGGRPKGTTKIPHDAEELQSAFARYVEEWESTSPSRDATQIQEEDFAGYFGAAVDALQRALRGAGISWYDVRRSYFGTE